MRHGRESNSRIGDLQSPALPFGYRAITISPLQSAWAVPQHAWHWTLRYQASTGFLVQAASSAFDSTLAACHILPAGSALKRQENLAAEIELNVLRLLNNSEVHATRLLQQASLIKEKGRSELIGSIFRAGSSFIGGFGGSKSGLDIDSNLITPQFRTTQRNTSGARQGFL